MTEKFLNALYIQNQNNFETHLGLSATCVVRDFEVQNRVKVLTQKIGIEKDESHKR